MVVLPNIISINYIVCGVYIFILLDKFSTIRSIYAMISL